MKDFPLEKYRFYFGKNKIVAISTFGGREVRGVAKCSPKDTFDIEKGKKLAAARCNMKVAEKRRERALNAFREAANNRFNAQIQEDKMTRYMTDANESFCEAAKKLESLLKEM